MYSAIILSKKRKEFYSLKRNIVTTDLVDEEPHDNWLSLSSEEETWTLNLTFERDEGDESQ